MVDVLEIVLGFALGLLSGAIIQNIRFRDSLKVEKVKRVTPLLEAVFPILEKLASDSIYAQTIQMRGDDSEFQRLIDRISISLVEYDKWYTRFQIAGLLPALESIDSNLLARFNGMFTHARLSKLHGLTYLSQNLSEFSLYCQSCKRILQTRLSK